MFSSARSASNLRIGEVRSTLDVIKTLEVPSGSTATDSDQVHILRGLYFVHLYSALEFAVNQCVQTTFREISAKKVPFAQLEKNFYILALDPRFASIRDCANDAKWSKRSELITQQFSTEQCVVSDTLLSNYLQNVWHDSLVTVFDCFSIKHPPTPDPRHKYYLDELVEKRNQVAHGRTSPLDVAKGMRSPELELRLNEVSKVIDHIFDCFEKYVSALQFIASAHHASFAKSPTP